MPEEPYEGPVLQLIDDEDNHVDTRQLPNLIPDEQLNGAHAACSHSGLIENSRALGEESAEPNDTPNTTTNELPVEGILVPEATFVTCTESQVKAMLKYADCLEIETAADARLPAKTEGLLQVADDELVQIDA
jgi:hypothetical protein